MKTFCLSRLLDLLALGGAAFSARALNPVLFNDGFAPLTPALTRFFLDLEAIPAGSTVTVAQHATLVADLSALPPGPAAPNADGVKVDTCITTATGSLLIAQRSTSEGSA